MITGRPSRDDQGMPRRAHQPLPPTMSATTRRTYMGAPPVRGSDPVSPPSPYWRRGGADQLERVVGREGLNNGL